MTATPARRKPVTKPVTTPADAVPSCPWLCDSGMISLEVT